MLSNAGLRVCVHSTEHQNRNGVTALILASDLGHLPVVRTLLKHDAARLGNRGPRRYSYGGASRTLHMMHIPAWSLLYDSDPVPGGSSRRAAQ